MGAVIAGLWLAMQAVVTKKEQEPRCICEAATTNHDDCVRIRYQ